MPQRKYQNPPLLETVAEFRFVTRGTWDAAIPGLVFLALKGTFPTRAMAHNVEVAPSDQGPAIQLQALIQFRSEDNARFVQLAPHYLSVHHTKPYSGWTAWAPTIQQVLQAYVETAKPAGVQRAGLRFVNRIAFSPGSIEPASYFNFYPHLGEQLPQHMAGFVTSVTLPFAEKRDGLRLQLRSAQPGPAPEHRPAVELDLDYYLRRPESLEVGDLTTWLDGAHLEIESVFEACLTDRTRQLFGKVEEH
jgi:uncharacterized protein (TIGR04255 family)